MPGNTWHPATPHIRLRRRRWSHQEGEAEPMAEHTGRPRVIRCKGSWLEMGRQYGSGFAMGVQSTSSRDVRVGVPRAMVSRSALCALSAAEAVREATRHHRSGGNGFVIVTPTGVQVIETSAAIDDVTEERPDRKSVV